MAHEAASGSAPPKDVLIFTDGEKLIGQIKSSDGSCLTFKSDVAGEVTVDWSKVKELRSSRNFAVIKKGVTLRWRQDMRNIPQGRISLNGQTLLVNTPAKRTSETVPVSDTQYIFDEGKFEKAVLERPGFFGDWKGTTALGIALVLATQDNHTYTSSISLSRSLPTETWMIPSRRTTLNFSSSFGKLTQPGSPPVKTSIYHADFEEDQYFSRSLFVFGESAFDHNFSQGLDLQQTYGSGVGWTAVKDVSDQFDLKGELTYVSQQFEVQDKDQHLFGSVFSEGYDHMFPHKLLLHEELSVSPAWTNTRAYTAFANVSLSMPVFKRVGMTVSAVDNFLNDPPPGFRKNSFQFTTGLTYALP